MPIDVIASRDRRDLNETENMILNNLSTVIDPELGVDIVNLGLVYYADLNDEGVLTVTMTLTTPLCPLGEVIVNDINGAFSEEPSVKEVQTVITFDPAWSSDKLSRFAKIGLGLF